MFTPKLVHNVHSRISHNSQKVEIIQSLSTDEWINKMWSVHAMGYYSAIKKNEVLTHASTWMNLENNKLSERRQIQKAMYYRLPFI